MHADKTPNIPMFAAPLPHSLHVLGALRLRRLSSCLIVCGPVRGSIYVEGCKNCVIVAAGRQVSQQ